MTRPIDELTVRRTVCDKFIRELMTMDDPRAKDAIEHYTAQLKVLDTELAQAQADERKRLGLPDPPDVVVNLKSARISSIAKKE